MYAGLISSSNLKHASILNLPRLVHLFSHWAPSRGMHRERGRLSPFSKNSKGFGNKRLRGLEERVRQLLTVRSWL